MKLKSPAAAMRAGFFVRARIPLARIGGQNTMIDYSKSWRMVRRACAPIARNGPLIALTMVVSIGLELFVWGYLFQTNRLEAHILGMVIPQALIEGVVISAQSLLALVAAFVAAERRIDPRPDQRAAAIVAQFLAVVLLIPPGLKAADGFAYPQQVDGAASFAASDEASALRQIVADPMADTQIKREAAQELARATVPTRARIDGTWWACLVFAAFLYGANMAAASMLWRAKPETPAERDRREKREDRQERARNRRAELMLEVEKARAKKPSWLRAVFTGRRKAA